MRCRTTIRTITGTGTTTTATATTTTTATTVNENRWISGAALDADLFPRHHGRLA